MSWRGLRLALIRLHLSSCPSSSFPWFLRWGCSNAASWSPVVLCVIRFYSHRDGVGAAISRLLVRNGWVLGGASKKVLEAVEWC